MVRQTIECTALLTIRELVALLNPSIPECLVVNATKNDPFTTVLTF